VGGPKIKHMPPSNSPYQATGREYSVPHTEYGPHVWSCAPVFPCRLSSYACDGCVLCVDHALCFLLGMVPQVVPPCCLLQPLPFSLSGVSCNCTVACVEQGTGVRLLVLPSTMPVG
jgi:hypothetical protein